MEFGVADLDEIRLLGEEWKVVAVIFSAQPPVKTRRTPLPLTYVQWRSRGQEAGTRSGCFSVLLGTPAHDRPAFAATRTIWIVLWSR